MKILPKSTIAAVLVGAAAAGTLAGAGSTLSGLSAGGGKTVIAADPGGEPKPAIGSTVASAVRDAGGTVGAIRQRLPQSGDRWGGCNDARAAGTAPIYRGEPGYRSDMDGDDDGIACEPISS